MEWLIELDKELLLAINGWNSSFFDYLMMFITSKWSGIPIYVWLLYTILRYHSINVALLMIGAILLTFALTDQLSVHLFKNTIERFRPGWDQSVDDFIRLLENKGGKYGFISSHAANFFGLAVISSGIIRKKWYTTFIFCWSAAVAYSRVYVGKHFPADVVCGAIFGALVGYLILRLYRYTIKKYGLKEDAIHK